MPSTTERLLSDTLLALSEKKSLAKITLKDILEASHVSRSTFYKKFQNMDDLIGYAFRIRIVDPSWDMLSSSYEDYYLGILVSLKKMVKYKKFCLELYSMSGPNAGPWSYLVSYSRQSEYQDMHELLDQTSKGLATQISYLDSYGSMNTMFAWLRGEIKGTAEDIAHLITDFRFILIAGFHERDKLSSRVKKIGRHQFLQTAD